MSMGKATTKSFVIELPLIVNPKQASVLLKRIELARMIYNACLGELLKRAKRMSQSKAYRTARKMPTGKKRTAAFRAMREEYGFTEYSIHAYSTKMKHSWMGDHLDCNSVQTAATRAFKAVNMYVLGKMGKPRFKGKNQVDSIDGKSNRSGMRWREERVLWKGLELLAKMPKKDDDGYCNDPVIRHGLESRIKYIRLVRRKFKSKNLWYVQLVCEGQPYIKKKNYLGTGNVGLDVGPSTIAIVSEKEAHLSQFCAGLEWDKTANRRLQRKLDRQRRANNPQNFHPDGTIKAGRKTWNESKGYLETKTKIAEADRIAAAHRKQMHGELVNEILRKGDSFKFEKLSYKAFQKLFGRSVGMRAPGMFISTLKRKAESAGGSCVEFGTWATRFSQLCHNCGTIEKKPLSQRHQVCDCGIVAQRDLYSAFLAMCYEDEKLNADYANKAWSGVESRLRMALNEAESTSIRGGYGAPDSFGLNQSQSRLSEKSKRIRGKAQDVVPAQNIELRELVDAA